MKEKLYNFIKSKHPYVKQVLDFKLKDCDDDDGAINEHYIVTCEVSAISPLSPTGFPTFVEKQCLVNVSEFKKWVNQVESIKWL